MRPLGQEPTFFDSYLLCGASMTTTAQAKCLCYVGLATPNSAGAPKNPRRKTRFPIIVVQRSQRHGSGSSFQLRAIRFQNIFVIFAVFCADSLLLYLILRAVTMAQHRRDAYDTLRPATFMLLFPKRLLPFAFLLLTFKCLCEALFCRSKIGIQS